MIGSEIFKSGLFDTTVGEFEFGFLGDKKFFNLLALLVFLNFLPSNDDISEFLLLVKLPESPGDILAVCGIFSIFKSVICETSDSDFL